MHKYIMKSRNQSCYSYNPSPAMALMWYPGYTLVACLRPKLCSIRANHTSRCLMEMHVLTGAGLSLSLALCRKTSASTYSYNYIYNGITHS